MNEYPVACGRAQVEEVISKSRFITVVTPFSEPEQLKQALAQVKQEFPNASHYCWAYLADAPTDTVKAGCSDDGEPSGTAGRPMLNALQGFGCGQVLAVVVRYYGGVKLGTGGLARAYVSGLKHALKQLPTKTKRLLKISRFTIDYQHAEPIQRLLRGCNGELLSQNYDDRVTFEVGLPKNQIDKFTLGVNNLTNGRVTVSFQNKS
ncbi:YigZ family protein [Paraferrimonas haliotis]|uniref:YigZ family protein n=1 Tax=Paraferrimonas haliotis TaxID=2013866 RepID=A0AA37TY91_9GAMM|nr:YigZ family protein [Paraferrimonas haliotis]GLS84819.1 YigZ family protein [Paraferrimonas haliotis]